MWSVLFAFLGALNTPGWSMCARDLSQGMTISDEMGGFWDTLDLPEQESVVTRIENFWARGPQTTEAFASLMESQLTGSIRQVKGWVPIFLKALSNRPSTKAEVRSRLNSVADKLARSS